MWALSSLGHGAWITTSLCSSSPSEVTNKLILIWWCYPIPTAGAQPLPSPPHLTHEQATTTHANLHLHGLKTMSPFFITSSAHFLWGHLCKDSMPVLHSRQCAALTSHFLCTCFLVKLMQITKLPWQFQLLVFHSACSPHGSSTADNWCVVRISSPNHLDECFLRSFP